jgi:hypothetical protein
MAHCLGRGSRGGWGIGVTSGEVRMTDASGPWGWPAGLTGGVWAGGRGERDDDRRPQRLDCARTVHPIEDAMAFVPKPSMRKAVVASLRAAFDAPGRREAERQLGLAVKKYRASAPRLADRLERNVPQGLAVFAPPPSHRRRLRTINMLERLNKELKRRTRVAGLFPNEASALRLVSAVAAAASSTEAAVTSTASSRPMLPTAMCRFRPSTSLALSRPRCWPPEVVSTDRLSTLAEVRGR